LPQVSTFTPPSSAATIRAVPIRAEEEGDMIVLLRRFHLKNNRNLRVEACLALRSVICFGIKRAFVYTDLKGVIHRQ
jgi:hypothetical protein